MAYPKQLHLGSNSYLFKGEPLIVLAASVLRKQVKRRRILSKLIRMAVWPADRLLAAKALGWGSWHVGTNRGIPNMLGVPLIAWINYHQREMIGHQQCHWLGHRALKNPMDAWIYQEILYEVKPDIIIELGNKNGGSTLFLAGICELMGHGRVLAVDIDHSQFTASHPRIELLTGDCGTEAVVDAVKRKCTEQKVLVIHDADHTKEAVLRDLRNFSPLVGLGSYFIVEDSILGIKGFGEGYDKGVGAFLIPKVDTPLQAIEQFLKENHDFVVDESRERYILTYNYRGYLRRVSL
jgi:cephalosporin hydroxylase